MREINQIHWLRHLFLYIYTYLFSVSQVFHFDLATSFFWFLFFFFVSGGDRHQYIRLYIYATGVSTRNIMIIPYISIVYFLHYIINHSFDNDILQLYHFFTLFYINYIIFCILLLLLFINISFH